MKKSSFFVGFSIIMLCIGVSAFGIYAALNPKISLTSSIGFNVHECMIEVSGTICNLAEEADNGASVSLVNREIKRTILGGEATFASAIDLGEMYFYYGAYTDPSTNVTTTKVFDIVIELTFTNLKDTGVNVSFGALPTIGSGVSLIHGDTNVGFTNLQNYFTTIDGHKSLTVKFALSLDDTSTVLDLVDFNWSNIEFQEVKATLDLVQTGTVKNSLDNDNGLTYHYINMGTNPYSTKEETSKLRWVPMAKYDESVQDFVAFDKKQEITAGTYYFISEFALDLPEDSAGGRGIVYNFTSNSDETKAAVYKNGVVTEPTDFIRMDYSISNVRSYLNGGEAYKSSLSDSLTGDTSFETYFGLKDDVIYNTCITSRSLGLQRSGANFSLYSDLPESTATDPYQTRPTTSNSFVESPIAKANDKDRLWLPSFCEWHNFYAKNYGDIFSYGARLSTLEQETQVSYQCWFRSSFISRITYFVMSSSNSTSTRGLTAIKSTISKLTILPAFQITFVEA